MLFSSNPRQQPIERTPSRKNAYGQNSMDQGYEGSKDRRSHEGEGQITIPGRKGQWRQEVRHAGREPNRIDQIEAMICFERRTVRRR